MKRRLFTILAAAALLGCQEKLTAPADCPALCPGDGLTLRDTVLTPEPGRDDTYPEVGGYVERGVGEAILVSNGLPAADARGVIRFIARPDTVPVGGDDYMEYTIDSVVVSLGLQARDTLAPGLELVLYRIPVDVADSTATFADIAPLLVPENALDTIPLEDDMERGPLRLVYSGADLARVAIPAADSGVLALAVALEAPEVTGVRLGSIAGGGTLAPRFITYVTVDAEDEDDQEQSITRSAAFTGWVAASEPAVDFSYLVVGGAPSKRALLRFPFTSALRDSVGIVRATLELTPAEPIIGLANDPAEMQARAILADFGAKSPPLSALVVEPGTATLEAPVDTVVSLDVTAIVRAWQASDSIPTALLLDLQPEAASFTRAVFESSTTGGDAAQPRLRITYSLPFDFEAP